MIALAAVCTCYEDVVCGPCMTGATTPGATSVDTEASTCPPDHGHGETSTCYTSHRCRCDKCREYARQHRYWLFHLRRAGRTPPGAALDARGVRRRLEALMAIGWSLPLIADRVGVHRSLVLRWLDAPVVEAKTITRVAAVYDELHTVHPPVDTSVRLGIANRTRRIAAERGFVGPHWWIDIDGDEDPPAADAPEIIDVVAVELAVAGEARAKLTIAERQEAVRQLNARGYYDGEIAIMLFVDERTIWRDRDALGIPAVEAGARETYHRDARGIAA